MSSDTTTQPVESGSVNAESTMDLWDSFYAALESFSCATTDETFLGFEIYHNLLTYDNG